MRAPFRINNILFLIILFENYPLRWDKMGYLSKYRLGFEMQYSCVNN